MQVLAPTVQDRDESNLRPQMFGVSGDGEQRLSRGLEQDGIDGGLVLKRDAGHRRRQREDHVEVGNRQEVTLPRREPIPTGLSLALRAMPVAAEAMGRAARA